MADPKAVPIQVVCESLNDRAEKLENILDADVMAFRGPIFGGMAGGMDERVRDALELTKVKRPKLAIVLDTNGGSIEVVQRMVDTIRHFYSELVFVIPDRAMSAGTVFALAGDEIMMDHYSRLGPIDPQVQRDGRWLPALAYLTQYNRLCKAAAAGTLTAADGILLQKLDLAELQLYEEARELSVSLLRKWLVAYKFKDWTMRETSKAPVAQDDKDKRAAAIADALSDHTRWHSHGRGISMDELRGDEIKLQIIDFGQNSALTSAIRAYFYLLRTFMDERNFPGFVHTRYFS